MTALNQQYLSEYGWVITLPAGWEPLEASGDGDPLIQNPPVVFASSANWSLSLTWMVAAGPVSSDVAERFVTLTMDTGPGDSLEAQTISAPIFPTIGEVEEAEIVELPDGTLALELVERFQSGSQVKYGYQLIAPLQEFPGRVDTFQRLCFYAPEDEFAGLIADVRESARSFHYVRPFGPPETYGE